MRHRTFPLWRPIRLGNRRVLLLVLPVDMSVTVDDQRLLLRAAALVAFAASERYSKACAGDPQKPATGKKWAIFHGKSSAWLNERSRRRPLGVYNLSEAPGEAVTLEIPVALRITATELDRLRQRAPAEQIREQVEGVAQVDLVIVIRVSR